ncbi:hypothetical protein ABW21_db0200274 [Orbilia brochopaga]|nr:hypothetical protein ABW21_db0200274 [Drechslerella brochopaga]
MSNADNPHVKYTPTWIRDLLRIPYISLDEVYWRPGWQETSTDDFQANIRTLLERYRDTGWIVDGDYTRRMGPLVAAERTDCIWLDPPLLLYLPRLICRTLLRLLHFAPPCAPGCDESLIMALQPNDTSIIWWCIFHHGSVRANGQQLMLQDGGVERGGKIRRLGGWGSEYRQWMAQLTRMVDQNRQDTSGGYISSMEPEEQ